VERRHVLRTLQKAHGNRTEAARLLQISVRGLQYKLKTYGREADATSGVRRRDLPQSGGP
jgi:DNA-binding NtrC family response regulator